MKIKVAQMKTDAQDNKPIVHIWGRSEDGKKAHLILHNFKPYFYVGSEPRAHSLISNVRESGVNLQNEPLWRVEVNMPTDVGIVRKDYKVHYEADVRFIDRVRYDLGIKSVIEVPDNLIDIGPEDITPAEADIKLRYWNIDIETSDKEGFADPKHPTGEVLSFVIYDSYDKILHACISANVNKDKVRKQLQDEAWLQEHIQTDNPIKPCDIPIKIYCVKDEMRLYMKLYQLYKRLKPDLIIGWNSITFDVAYLKERVNNRARKYPCPKFQDINELDLMESYKKLYKAKVGELLSKSLEFCGITELGYGKLKHNDGFFNLYDKDPEKFLAYNIWDTVVSERVNEAQDVLYYFQKLTDMAGTGINNVHYSSQLIDALILHRLHGVVVLPSKTNLNERLEVRGGYVHKPSSGIHEWVTTIDFKQQYPSAIRSLNMSPETRITGKVKKGSYFTVPSGTKYLKEPRGLLPMILDEMSVERDNKKAEMNKYKIGTLKYKAKDAEQTAFKFFMNSFYGIMATKKPIFRLTDNVVGFDIPDTAKWFTKGTIEFAESRSVNVIYGDTDSCLVQFTNDKKAEEVLEAAQSFVKDVNEEYNIMVWKLGNTGEPHHFNIEAEIIYEKYFQSARIKNGELVGKKRYAGIMAWKDGVWLLDKPPEERLVIKGYETRRSNSARLTRDLQEDVLLMILAGYSIIEIRDKIKTIIDEVRAGKHREELGIPTGIGQENYDRKPAFVRAFEFSNAYLGYNFKYGDKPIWYYGYIDGKPQTDVFAIDYGDKLPEDAIIDIERMIERCIVGPLDAIVEGLGYSWSEFLGGEKLTKQKVLF